MKLKISSLTRMFTFLLIAIFAVISICFIPNFAEYLCQYMKASGSFSVPRELIYAFGALVSIPCEVILFMSLSLSDAIENDAVFTAKTAETFSAISLILFVDCAVFLGSIIMLFCVGEFTVSPLFALVDLIGFGLSVLLYLLSGYIKRAASLKEEVDATL
jgi:hypothetical protein